MTRVIGLTLLLLASGCGDDDDDTVVVHRPATVAGGVAFGDVCEVNEDCGDVAAGAECCTGGKCSPDGWCSPRCDSDQDCPEGFFCIDHDGTRCFMACGDDRDCFPGWTCEEKDHQFTCRYRD